MAVGLAAVVLGLAIGWAYAPILDNAFVWDDGANLIAARAHWDAGLRGVAWAFREPFAGHYQPLTWLSYQLDARLSGATPRGVHATQIALHLLVTLAVAALARALAASPRLRGQRALQGPVFPLVAAALFGLAPIRVESVAWATERRDLLGGLFAVACVALYLHTGTSERRTARVRFGVALLAALSALSRAQMTLPFVLLVLDVWPLRRLTEPCGRRLAALRPLVREKAPLFAIAAGSACAAIWAQSRSGALTGLHEHGVLDRVVQAGHGLAYYPVASLLPPGFSEFLPLYERPAPFTPLAAEYLVPAIASALVLSALWLQRNRVPALGAACAAYALLVLPVLGIAQSGIQLVADRYAYLATIPLVLWVAGGGCLAYGATRRRLLRAGIAACLFGLLVSSAFATRRQTLVWHDDFTLWRHVLAHSESSLAHNNLGQMLYARGEPGAALFHLTRCLERTPGYPRPWAALAAILEAPWPDRAPPAPWVAATLARALPYQPALPMARYASALAWTRSGDTLQAERDLRHLLALDPAHDGARLALARIEAQRRSAGQ